MRKNVLHFLLLFLFIALGFLSFRLLQTRQDLKAQDLELAVLHEALHRMVPADSLLRLGQPDAALALFPEGRIRDDQQERLTRWEERLQVHRLALDSLERQRDSLLDLAGKQRLLQGRLHRELDRREKNKVREERSMERLTDSIRSLVVLREKEESLLRHTLRDNEGLVDSLRAAITALEERLENRRYLRWKSPKGVDIIYIGDTDGEQPHGQGTGIWKNGTFYEGEWVKGEKHGKGLYQFPQGERYEGDFAHNRREGYGVYSWKNGDVYHGQWKNDLRDGEGLIRNKEGKIIKRGIWKEDKIVRSTEVPEGH
jgi:hypothetical protein